MRNVVHSLGSAVPKTLRELYAAYPIRPIHDEVDLDNAMEVADRLAVLAERTRDQNDYLEMLSGALEKYEKEHDPINTEELDPMETLALLMRQRNMNASDLGRVLGNRSLGTKILNRRRGLSQSHISALCEHFAVGPQVFFARPSTSRGGTAPARKRKPDSTASGRASPAKPSRPRTSAKPKSRV